MENRPTHERRALRNGSSAVSDGSGPAPFPTRCRKDAGIAGIIQLMRAIWVNLDASQIVIPAQAGTHASVGFLRIDAAGA